MTHIFRPSGGGAAVPRGRWRTSGGTVYFVLPGVAVTSTGTAAYAANTIYYQAIIVDTTVTYDQISCEVTSAATAGKLIRMAIITADTDWQPATLVLDSGTVTADSIAVKNVAISQQLTPGRYLLSVQSDGAPTLREYIGYIPGNPLSASGNTVGYFTVANTFAAYGAAVAWSTGSNSSPRYPVWLRVGTA